MKAELLSLNELAEKIPDTSIISLSGAGGKTTLMFRLAKLLKGPVAATTTTKVGADQIMMADMQITCVQFPPEVSVKTTWVSPSLIPENGKIHGCSPSEFSRLAEQCITNGYSLINEADGAARRHIKAPGEFEPVIPPETNVCIYLVGLDVLGVTVNSENVHRPEILSQITGAEIGSNITAEHILKLFDHSNGGLKNMPSGSFHIAYLTHADTTERISAGQFIAESLKNYDIICINT